MKNTNTHTVTLTKLEAAALSVIASGMDEPNCGWYHELFTTKSHTDRAVFGSLVKKGLAKTFRDLDGPEPCDWIELTPLGESVCPEGVWEGRL